MSALRIVEADPQGEQALALLRESAIEVRALYPELVTPEMPWPSNPPAAPRSVYLLALLGEEPVGSGALAPLEPTIAEVRRIFVRSDTRRLGVARAILAALEERALWLGFRVLRLETGFRQQPAMTLYETCGFRRIPQFGRYIGDPISVCYEKALTQVTDDRMDKETGQ